jgi:hypothetical protein
MPYGFWPAGYVSIFDVKYPEIKPKEVEESMDGWVDEEE